MSTKEVRGDLDTLMWLKQCIALKYFQYSTLNNSIDFSLTSKILPIFRNYKKCNISFVCNFRTKLGFIILTEDLEAPEYVDSENGKDFENLLKINFIEI